MQSGTEKLIAGFVNDALLGKQDNLEMRLRQLVSKTRTSSPNLSNELTFILEQFYGNQTAIRGLDKKEHNPVPVDADTRQNLLVEEYPVVLENEPLWSETIFNALIRVVSERERTTELLENGLLPSKSVLMDGPPGVGKTLAAHWLASRLNLPLLTLDLASVMSSYLGKTGNNIRAVLNYARKFPCVLLLDEFDSIAKKRDDDSDVGELKRLVTVLLQAVDDWPYTSVLVAATNHGELLDPAVWRRFDRVIHFDIPSKDLITEFLVAHEVNEKAASFLSASLEGNSFALLKRAIIQAKRNSILEECSFHKALFEEFNVAHDIEDIVIKLYEGGLSQRQISKDLELSRVVVSRIINNSN